MDPKISFLAKAALPLLLVGAVAVGTWFWRSGSLRGLVDGRTYEIWLREAEVAPTDRDGNPWDPDGSGPDLTGIVSWQDQRILETTVASGGAIARWEPLAVKPVEILMKGEADAATVRRVGRFRMARGGFLEVGVFDDDPFDREFVGAFRIPMESLRPGVNGIRNDGTLCRLVMVVADPDNPHAEDGEHEMGAGVARLEAPPVSMLGKSRRMADAVDEAAKHISRELEQEIERAAGEIEKTIETWGRELEAEPTE